MTSVRYGVACAVLIFCAGISRAQSGRDGWLMQNYRFTGPLVGPVTPTDPVMSQLQEIQNTTLAILRKANFAGDYEAALAAAAQAVHNAQLMGAINERRQGTRPSAPPPEGASSSSEQSTPAIYLIALQDGAIRAVKSYWSDGRMLHCITLEGAHEQIRLDLVDRKLSEELNRSVEPKEQRY